MIPKMWTHNPPSAHKMLLDDMGDDFRWYMNIALNNMDSHCKKLYFISHFLSRRKTRSDASGSLIPPDIPSQPK